jgi:prolyl oligopeptidase
MLDRRQFLAAASTAALAGVVSKTALANVMPPENELPPVARVEPVTETMFGKTITDDYRWMETPADKDWEPYMRGQAAYARAQLDAIPGRADLLKKVSGLSGDLEVASGIQVAGENVFVEKRPAGANNFRLFVRKGFDGPERLLIDPETRTKGDVHYSLDFWIASPNGTWIAYGISAAGSENSIIEIMEVATGKVLPERIDRAQYAGPSWLPDSSGFFFNRLADGEKLGSLGYYKNSVCWLHKLNTDPKTDVKVLAPGKHKGMTINEIEFPYVSVVAGSEHVVAGLFAGVQNEITLYVNTLKAAMTGADGWRKICGPDDKVTGWTQRGDDIYLLTYQGAPRYRVLKVTAQKPAVATANEVVAQSNVVIQGVAAARDAIFVRDLKDGISTMRRLTADGTLTSVALPFAGTTGNAFIDPAQEGAVFGLRSWVRPNTIYRADAAGKVSPTTLVAPPKIDVSGYDSVEVLAKAKDGVTVPLSIVFKKGVKRDGSAPTLMQAYGSYGINQDAFFNARMTAWLDKGGVWATAKVRGGGERGREWHEGGRLATKPNTWRDLIACAEYLIAEKWTSAKKLAINGGSAGGITMGMAMAERPDLFGAVIANVGTHNTLRMEFSQNGPPNIPEFGSVKTEAGFKGLLAMDSTQALKKGVKYPATLLTTGMTDPRVMPWQIAKFAAHLQAKSASGKPVLLRVDFNAGHGLGSTRAQRDAEVTDMFAFILQQTGSL